MKQIFLLTKILLKGSTGSNKSNTQKNKNFFSKFLLYSIIYLYIAGIVCYISYEAISALKMINQEAIFLSLSFTVMLGFTTIRTLFSSMNVLFFSKDIEYLLPLPIKPYKIIISKLNCLIISEYILYSVILLPVMVVYGILMKLGFIYYILSLGILLMFPILPIVLVSLLVTVIMKFTKIIRNKDFVQYITVILSLIFIVGIQLISVGEEKTTDELVELLMQTNGIVSMYSKYFITLEPTIQTILNYNNINGIANFGILLLETFVIYFIIVKILSVFYIRTVTSLTTSTSKKKKNKDKKTQKQSTVGKAYVRKEFKNLIRNPIFFMQCVAPSILFPIILIISMYAGIKNEPTGVEEIRVFIKNALEMPKGIAVIEAITIFLFMFNFISITAISRDGENAVFMKYIPISLKKQCLYKILPGIIMNIIPIIYVDIGLKLLVENISILDIVIIDFIAMLINILGNYLMILIDLNRPKLHWTSEYTVVKQNFNMFFEMIIYLLKIGIMLFLGFFITNKLFFVSIVCLTVIVLTFYTKKYIQKNENKLFSKIL